MSINAVGLVDAKMEHKMFCEYEVGTCTVFPSCIEICTVKPV